VNFIIVHPNPVTGRPLRGSAAFFSLISYPCFFWGGFLKDKGEQKFRESADSCRRMGVDFSPVVFDSWGGGASRGWEGGVRNVV